VRRTDAPALALMLVLLGGCASSSRPALEPRLRQQAQEVEAAGARRHAQGDYTAAARQFAEATRLHLSLDDGRAAARNRLQLAQTQLALGQAQPALDQAAQVRDAELQVPTLLLQAQAHLALAQAAAAAAALDRLASLCPAGCEERGRLLLLQARLAWAGGDAVQTAQRATAALPLLRARGEERETANALRLLAAAQLQTRDAAAALGSARAALAIDRQQALPEKIARDWLLIGDIQRRMAPAEAPAAYQRARTVAQAAGLPELARQAEQSLKESPP